MNKLPFRTIAERRSSDFYGSSVGRSTVKAKPPVVASSRQITDGDTFTKGDRVYFSLSAWDLRSDLDAKARYRLAS